MLVMFQVVENENQVVFSLTIDGKAKSIVVETVIVQLLNYVRRKQHAIPSLVD